MCRQGKYSRRASGALTVVLTASLLAAACGETTQETAEGIEQPSEIVMRSNGPCCFTLAIDYVIAEVNGYFEEEGLENTDHQALSGDGTVAAAMAGDSVQFADIGPEAVAVAQAEGEQLYVIAANAARPAYYLITKPEITSVQDLEGGNFGIVGPGSTDHSMAGDLLLREGLETDAVSYPHVGIGPPKIAALESGAIDAGFYTEREAEYFEEIGFNVLIDMRDVFPAYHQRVFAASREMVEEYPEATTAWLRAMLRARQFIYENEEATKEAWVEYGGDEDFFDTEYRRYLEDNPIDMQIMMEGIEPVIEGKKRLGDLPSDFDADQILRTDLLDAAQEAVLTRPAD